MKRTDLPDRFQDLLQRIPYATIATVCPDGRPWNSPVAATFDNDMNVYWVSWKENRHSRNIAGNPQIFVVVYDSQVPLGQGEGLYLEMKAYALNSPDELRAARSVLGAGLFQAEQFTGDFPRRIYRATPERLWYNGDGTQQGYFVDVRHEIIRR